MTSNNLDLSSATDDGIAYGTSTSTGSPTSARRTKRGAINTAAQHNNSYVMMTSYINKIVSSSSSALTASTNIIAIPLLFFFHLLSLFYQFLSNILPEPITRPIINLLETDTDSDKLLKEMEPKQVKLQSDVATVGKDQQKLRSDMDGLKERIRKLEERRERWAREAEKIDREREENVSADGAKVASAENKKDE